tara:strand:+ start:149377 stop:150033 length:657 start_codon:yes stop_codon:yes gene_type:complete
MSTQTLTQAAPNKNKNKNKALPMAKKQTSQKQQTRAPKTTLNKSNAQKTISTSNTSALKVRMQKTTSSALDKWLSLPRKHLDEIYKHARPGELPQGDTRGTAILAGGPLPKLFAKAANLLAWQGKVFDLFAPDFNSGVVVNKVSPLGLNLIVAKTYRGASWMDGKETIIIDYSGTSLFAKQIRDEIREVEPGLYLGKVWWGKTRILDFALETHQVIPA